MGRTNLNLLLTTILLILAQAVVFNRICLWGVAVPFVFLYPLLKLPVTISREWAITIGFVVGLIIDIFSDTPGLNALSCTLMMALRRPVIHLYVQRDEDLPNPYPSIKSLGSDTYTKYALTMSLVYCILVFTLANLSFERLGHTILTILTSTILTTIILICIDSLTRRREKGL